MKHTCKCCSKEFEAYKRDEDCRNCEDGSVEIQAEFGEDSFFGKCRSCNGKGVYEILETDCCDEDCLIAYHEEHFNS